MNLNTLFDFKPGTEISIMNGCPQRCEGIWDILGYYDSKSCLVTICELEITEFTKKLRPVNNEEYKQIRQTLKELVRLHEHVHSLIHNCNFDKLLGIPKEKVEFTLPVASDSIYQGIPKEINETLCEFISFSAIINLNWISYERLFYKVDKCSPPEYQRWKDIRDVIDVTFKKQKKRDYIYIIPSLIKLSRKKKYQTLQDFIEGIITEKEEINIEFQLLKGILKIV